MFIVGCFVNGSMNAVSQSGINSMSDSWISWNPRIELPSNGWPSVSFSSVSSCTGTDRCWT